jgi:WG repeat protein
MLHLVVKEKDCFWILMLLLLTVLPGCKKYAEEQHAEEEIYLADYEPPLEKWGYMDTLGQLRIDPLFDDVGFFSEGLANVNKNGRWGYIDRSGDYVVEPTYKAAWAFHEGMARVSPFNGPDHYITRSGKILKSEKWSAADDFSQGLAKVKVGNSFSYIDTTGHLVLPAIYARAWSFKHGLAIVSNDEKLGIINTKGNEILPQQFNTIKIIEEANLILANSNSEAHIYDLLGQKKISLPGVKAIDSDGTVVAIQKGGLMFFLELTDETILIGPGWSNVIYLGEQRWAGKNDKGFFLLNNTGTKINLKPLSQINKFVEGMCVYYTGEHWGYMDINGKELTPDVFGLAWDFKNGFARAAFNEGIAFINRKLELGFYPPPGTLDMKDFTEGLAPVQIQN